MTILGLFSHWIWFLDTQNRFYFIVKRLKNAFLMYFYKVRIGSFDKSQIFYVYPQGGGVRGSLWSKKNLGGKIRYKSYMIINQSQNSNSKFFTFSWPLRGRGQPKRSAWPLFHSFFFWPLPLGLQYKCKPVVYCFFGFIQYALVWYIMQKWTLVFRFFWLFVSMNFWITDFSGFVYYSSGFSVFFFWFCSLLALSTVRCSQSRP